MEQNRIENKQKKSVWAIVIFVIVALMLAAELAIGSPKESLDPPSRLPAPPVQIETIIGMEQHGFSESEQTLFIRGVDDLAYEFNDPYGKMNEWAVLSEPAYDKGGNFLDLEDIQKGGSACEAEELRSIESTGGTVTTCLRYSLYGEVCSGGNVAYALTADGSLWRQHIPEPCSPFPTILLACNYFAPLLVVVGLVIGLIFVFLKIREANQA